MKGESIKNAIFTFSWSHSRGLSFLTLMPTDCFEIVEFAYGCEVRNVT